MICASSDICPDGLRNGTYDTAYPAGHEVHSGKTMVMSCLAKARRDKEGARPMQPESPQPTHRPLQGRANGRLVATINLFVSAALLLSLCAAWVFIPIARVPAVCVFHHKPWWFSLVEESAFLLIPTSIVVGILAINSLRHEDRRLRRLGIVTIILGVLLLLSLGWAEFLYFVCQL